MAGCKNAATQMDQLIAQWRSLEEFIGMVDAADLDAMNVSSTDGVRTDLINFRTVLGEIIAFYDGTSTTQTQIPADVIDKIRSM